MKKLARTKLYLWLKTGKKNFLLKAPIVVRKHPVFCLDAETEKLSSVFSEFDLFFGGVSLSCLSRSFVLNSTS